MDQKQFGSGVQRQSKKSWKQQLFPRQMSPGQPDAHTQPPIDMSAAVEHDVAHVPLQHSWPGPQVTPPQPHLPLSQVSPDPQARPQPLQLLMSDMRLLQPFAPQQV
jgi:hypothetical protein